MCNDGERSAPFEFAPEDELPKGVVDEAAAADFSDSESETEEESALSFFEYVDQIVGVSRRDRRIDSAQVRRLMDLGLRSDQVITRYNDEGEEQTSCVMALVLDKKLNFLIEIFMSQEPYSPDNIEAVIAMSETGRQEVLDRMIFIACEMANYQKNIMGEDASVTLSNIFTLLDAGSSITACFDDLNSLASLTNILDVDKLSEILSEREFSVQDLVIAIGGTPISANRLTL